MTFLQVFFGVLCLSVTKVSGVPVFAATENQTATACSLLKAQLGAVTFSPSQIEYLSLSTENWSETAWQKPICIVQPVDTSELQKAAQILTKQHVHFAIRSGGHSPSPLAANINDGVLIDMSMFNRVYYDAANDVAMIGAGLKWKDVYNHLDPYNVTVVGGRVLDVGVGGLILGGGLSYLSDLYGLACDNVVNFEVVLANGSIVDANAESNQDLFWALKGGGNNFGIVTTFTLSTYPIHQVWGGIKSYSFKELPALFSAMHEYQSNPKKDPYANLMMQAFPTNASFGVLLNMVYLKPEESPPAFDPFYVIPTTADTTKIQTLTEMMSGLQVPAISRWDWFATSFKPDASLYKEVETIVTTAPELEEIKSLTSGSMVLGMQPISSSLVDAGNARGGNALGLECINQTWFVLDAGWSFSNGDETAHNATRAIHDRIEDAGKSDGNYVPYIFMNDASWDQEVIGHYGAENVRRLWEVQRKYDPECVFQELASGGFKLPRTESV
ncbi:MAG: hypothetical protein M1816_000858 [Peltula sp. TS41687]|nr:MAG: hypothetical protein M1816_000858 [Peltula sp. TS41687]